MLGEGDVVRHGFSGDHPDGVQTAVPDLIRREGSRQSAPLVNQCADLGFGDGASRDGLPIVLQGAIPGDQAASPVSSPAFEGTDGAVDLGVQFGEDIIPVELGFAGVHPGLATP